MKKILRSLILILFVLLLFRISLTYKETLIKETFNWNNGYCELDGGRLNYISVGSRYRYKCEICGKEYLFDKVMSRK